MSFLTILWAFIPRRYLIAAAALVAVLLGGYAALRLYGAHRASSGYALGYTRARDSVWVAEMRKRVVLQDSLERRADSIGTAALHSEATLNAALHSDSAAIAAPRHTPRIEALTVPVTADTTLVGVFVQNTGEHFVLPRRAAEYWQTSDSLVGVAQRLLAKYEKANHDWSEAWHAENEARVGADSLAALWRARALANVAPPKQSHAKRDMVFTALGIAAGFIASRHIR